MGFGVCKGRALELLLVCGIAIVLGTGLAHQTAHAENDLIGGIGDVVSGVLALPVDVLAGTLQGPPLFGTISGALHGTVRAIGLTTRGVFRLASLVVPLAKAAAPYVLPFLL